MLGRGPTCYNNPGNRVFRKLVKEHVTHYKNEARRKEKAALVQLLVSKIEGNGYRFLHRSTAGTWVEAPPHIVKNKVGHGLRDARIEAGRVGGDVNVSPKKSRPNRKEQKPTLQIKPVITVQAKVSEEMRVEDSGNTVMISTGEDLSFDSDSSSAKDLKQDAPIPEKEQQLLDGKAPSNLNKALASDLMSHEPIPERGQQRLDEKAPSNVHKDLTSDLMLPAPIPGKGQPLLDAKAPSNLNKSLDSDFMSHEQLPADGLWEDTIQLLVDDEIEEFSEHWGGSGHVNNIADLWLHECPTASEADQGLKDGELSWDDKNDTRVLPDTSSSHLATNAGHVLETLDVALTIYAAFYEGSPSFEDCVAGDPYEPLKYDVEGPPSLCRWLCQSV
ncbi:hypothetical protein MHU86_10102 [Fragilaria crotonensis]|nr:hypothetical protein MHU86_10102 [Fragilaria crotonensis]